MSNFYSAITVCRCRSAYFKSYATLFYTLNNENNCFKFKIKYEIIERNKMKNSKIKNWRLMLGTIDFFSTFSSHCIIEFDI